MMSHDASHVTSFASPARIPFPALPPENCSGGSEADLGQQPVVGAGQGHIIDFSNNPIAGPKVDNQKQNLRGDLGTVSSAAKYCSMSR